MDDFQTLLYILFFIIYVVSRIMKKSPKKNVPPPVRRKNKATSTPQGNTQKQAKPLSFEELLEQFTNEGKSKPKREPQKPEAPKPAKRQPSKPQSTPAYTSYETIPDHDEANSLEILDEQEAYQSPALKYDKFSRYDQEEKETFPDIKTLLSNPGDARQAIILSEILNRKY